MPRYLVRATSSRPQSFIVNDDNEDHARQWVEEGREKPIAENLDYQGQNTWDIVSVKEIPDHPEGICTKFMRFEYDEDYFGGDYTQVGDSKYIPLWLVNRLGCEPAFYAFAELDPVHIITRYEDEWFDVDGGEWLKPALKWAEEQVKLLRSAGVDTLALTEIRLPDESNAWYESWAIEVTAFDPDNQTSKYQFKVIGALEDARGVRAALEEAFIAEGFGMIPF